MSIVVTKMSTGDIGFDTTDLGEYNKETGEIIDRHCHHESARRGAKTGTQGLKGNYERSKVPKELCEEILTQTLERTDWWQKNNCY